MQWAPMIWDMMLKRYSFDMSGRRRDDECVRSNSPSDGRERIMFVPKVSRVALQRPHIATADQATLNPSDKIKEYMQVMSILEGNASVTKRQQL